MRILVTRPAEDSGPLRQRLEVLGHAVIAVPLMTIRPRDGVAIPDRPWQAIAATSANGIRMLPHPERFRAIRTLTVGPQSLKAARDQGLPAAAHGGDVDGLAAFIRDHLDPAAGPLLYLSGAETAGDLEAQVKQAGFDCHRAILYDAVPAPGLGAAREALQSSAIDAVLLYSPRTAKIWRDLVRCDRLEEPAARPVYLCLSRNVAAVLPESWTSRIAASPDEAAMLALLDQIPRTR